MAETPKLPLVVTTELENLPKLGEETGFKSNALALPTASASAASRTKERTSEMGDEEFLAAEGGLVPRLATAEAPLPASQIAALKRFYDCTNGPNWYQNEESGGAAWNFSTRSGSFLSDPCIDNWYGVACNNSTLVGLHLSIYDLMGTIPSEVGLLTGLSYLDLSINSLKGGLPSELALLSGLTRLDLSSNYFVGTLPTELEHLTGLQDLSLSANCLTGSLPTELGVLAGLRVLDLAMNIFEGSLVSEIWRMSGLQALKLSANSLVGSIPSNLCRLTGLTELRLNTNSLVGTLPTEMGRLTGLTVLSLFLNRLDGSLPTELGRLTGLQVIDMQDNLLTGSLPTEMGLLTGLQYLYLRKNMFAGTLPTELGLLTGLQLLNLNFNHLNGSLPSELGLLTGLTKLTMYSNRLAGTVPTELGLLTGMNSLMLKINCLGGSIPSELGLLTNLEELDLSRNQLDGYIPTEFGLITGGGDFGLGFMYLALSFNSLVGKIPTELGRLTMLLRLDLERNQLTGPLPSELGRMISLQSIFLGNNRLEGSLPSELGSLKLFYLSLSQNSIVGKIPTVLGRMKDIFYLSLSQNRLEGTIPTELWELKKLVGLNLDGNSLVGSLPRYFPDDLRLFEVIAVHDNNLQGQLPSKLPPNLQALSVTKNCFTGTLSPSLCNASSLQYLILDGLSAGKACQKPMWPINPFGLNALSSTSRMIGSIPACIYSLPKLKTLHVSGNGLRGSLQAGPAGWSASLVDLSLSHNALTGETPPSLKLRLHNFSKFDLSYNNVGGTLDGFQPGNQSGQFFFDVNRLSGEIPSAVAETKGAVSVLQGNLFECSRLDRGDSLPPADPAYSEYSCGSHLIDTYFIIFLVFLVLSSAAAWSSLSGWLASRNKVFLEALQKRPVSIQIQAVLYRLRRLAMLAGAVLLLVYLPLYGVLKTFFKTYDFQYSWTVAAIMLSGEAPAAVLLAFWTLALAAVSACILVWFRNLKGSTAAVAEAAPAASTWSEQCRLALRLAMIAILNLTVAGAANIAFVVVTVGSYSSTEKSLATVALGLYKTAWSILLPHVIDSQALLLGVDRAVEERTRWLSAGDLFRTLLQIFNAVVMPALAVAVTDPSCFKHLLYAAPSIRSSFTMDIHIPLFASYPYQLFSASIDFKPAFSYNYECTSTLVEKFSPVFAQVALTSAFVIPLMAYGARWALDSMQSRGIGSRLPGLRGVFLAMLPSLLLYRKSERNALGRLRFLRPKKFIKADEVLRQSVSDLALMLSIGLVVPLLGLMFAASIVSRCLMWEFLVDRFLSQPDEHLVGDERAVEEQCLQLGGLGRTALYNARWLLVCFPSLFLALFVADIAGDAAAAGIESALWAPILMSVLPPSALFVLNRMVLPEAHAANAPPPPPPPPAAAASLADQEAREARGSFALSIIAMTDNPVLKAAHSQTSDAFEDNPAHHKASAVISSSLASENASPLNVFTETAAAAAASRSSMAAKIEEVGCDNIPEPTTAQTRRFYPSIQFC